jgi:Signal peptide peptidase
LKFDVDLALERKTLKMDNKKSPNKRVSCDRPYFFCVMIGYLAGIIATFIVMTVFEHPQPALFYLVPGCTFSVILLAAFRGEFWKLVNYDQTLMLQNKKAK